MERISTKPGEKIRTLRKQKDLTLQRLAELARVSLSYLQSLEQDERPNGPNVQIAQRIALALGVSVADIWPSNMPADGRSAS